MSNKTQFKVGDHVRVYGNFKQGNGHMIYLRGHKGTVVETVFHNMNPDDSELTVEVKDWGRGTVHPRQLRRLKPKAKSFELATLPDSLWLRHDSQHNTCPLCSLAESLRYLAVAPLERYKPVYTEYIKAAPKSTAGRTIYEAIASGKPYKRIDHPDWSVGGLVPCAGSCSVQHRDCSSFARKLLIGGVSWLTTESMNAIDWVIK